MNIKVKKIIPFTILLIIILSIAISILASPKTYAATTDDGLFDYSVQDNYVKITKYKGNQTTVIIPSTIDGYPVTIIGNQAFSSCSSIETLQIPNSVETIDSFAFQHCTGLLSITIPEGVKNIGYDSFWDCSNLKSINLPNTLITIDSFAFQKCESLSSITIPQNVNSIGYGVFRECNQLSRIDVDINNNDYCNNNNDGVLYDKNMTEIISYPPGNKNTTFTIANSINTIFNYAFSDCSNLTQINIPNGVTTIGFDAFYKCENLTQVEIPNSVTEIGNQAFSGCSQLTSINIPQSVTQIPASLFEQSGIEQIDIPDQVTSIGNSAFAGCEQLSYVIIPGSVTSIGYKSFKNCTNLSNLIAPSSVNVPVGGNPDCFEGCDKLTITTKSITTTYKSSIYEYALEKGINLNLDNDGPSLQVTFSTTNPTRENVNVTITANEDIQRLVSDNRNWNYIANTNKKSITATFTENITNEQLKIKDLVGNETTTTININNIDHTAPTVTVTTDKATYKADETAIITATFNEAIQDETPKISMSGISTLAETKMTKSSDKIYTYNYVIPNKSGTQTITISGASDIAGNIMNTNSTKTFDVTPTINSIDITTAPIKTTYIEGQNFDASGMKVTANYNDGTSKEVTNYSISDGNNLAIGKTTVTVSYTENGVTKTTTQAITVSQKVLSSIRVSTSPSKTTYIEGQDFDATGMKVTATYNNGSTKEITNYTITDGNNLTTDKTSVTISYIENEITKTTTQTITVSQKTLSNIKVSTEPSKKIYIEGQNFDTDGMEVTATYDNGSTKEVTNYTITNGNNLTTDKTSVTISYTENSVTKATTQAITVVKKALTSIEITTAPAKTTYIEGQNFDATGMKVTAKYSDNSSEEITNYTITDGNDLRVDKTSVTISYTESGITKTTTQPITVTKKLEISFDGYNEVNKDGNKYVDNIAPNTNLEDMINNVETNGTITVYKDNKIITDNKTKMSTGMKIKISLNNEIHEFTIVVKGDTNGDGESNLKDLLQINKHRLNKTLLTAEHLLAGDVNKDNEVNLKDLLQINKFRLGKINTL